MAYDYYEVLGVSRDSSKEEIKRAYRRLARKYHPDVNRETGAEDRFKEINRAYEVLSDTELKSRYDRFGEAGLGGGGAAGYQDPNMSGFADIFESFFTNFAGGAAGYSRSRTGPVRGDDLRFDLKLEFLEAVFGGEKQIRISHLETCSVCEGSGSKPGTGSKTCGTCNGVGQVRRATRTPFGSFTQVSVCPTCNGVGKVIEEPCSACLGEGSTQQTKKIRITVPAGVDSGTRLRVSGEGDVGRRGGTPGDLYVYLFVESDPYFRREGLDIFSEVKVSYLQAILGTKISVPTLDSQAEKEEPVELEIPAGSQPGTVLVLADKGVPKVGNPVARGEHRISLVIDIPTRLTHEERELLEKLAEIRGDKVSRGRDGFLGNLFRGLTHPHRDEE